MEQTASIIEMLNECNQPNKIVKTVDLILGKEYQIYSFENYNTRYGQRLAAVLDNGIYFLPPMYARILTKKAKYPEDLLSDCKLVMDGRRSDKHKSPILRFIGKIAFDENTSDLSMNSN